MCGIAGFIGRGDLSVLNKMNNTLIHRGPDDFGSQIFTNEDDKKNIAIAQRRLSIIDLSPTGHQPMANEDKSVWVVFNGEIYNFKKLKKGLRRKHNFNGKSDTEIILHLYEEIGEDVFSKLEGMFAIALYDKNKNKFFIARDRMGKKPLYWSVQNETFLFGSELKALMVHPSFNREIDLQSLNKYFQYEYVPTPHTIFKNTWKLEPGTYLEWDGCRARKTQFWKPTFLPKSNYFKKSLASLDKALDNAVKDRLVSDVPLGVFLSGGVDSSVIAYYASKENKNKVKTFAIGFKEESFDESKYARKVAEHLGTEHYEKILSVKECIGLIEKIGGSMDEPLADSSIVPTYLLSNFTHEHVTVALGGDGGDELFCGYDTFLAHKVAVFYEYVPAFLRKAIAYLVNFLPTSHSNMSLDFKLKKSTSGFEGDPKYRDQRWLGAFGDSDRKKLFNKDVLEEIESDNVFEDIDRYIEEADSEKKFDKLGYLYERMYMMDDVLVKVDRVSMMNSLEVRTPFLDTSVVDLANHMPTNFKFKWFERKYILKKLMEGKLPKEIIYRKKKGFGMPIGEWMRGEMRPMLENFLGKEQLDRIGLFNVDYIKKVMNDHMEGRKDNRKQLWTLLIFILWWNEWMS